MNVRTIVVLGHVSPRNARVLVAGRWARVRRGTFRLRLRLPQPVDHISILADANGFRPASLTTTVRLRGSASTSRRHAGASEPGLPSDFPTRAETICSTANQQMAGLPQITPQTFLAIWHQLLTIRANENRQLIALVGPAAGRPAVRTFINDLRVKAAFASRFLDDLTQGRREAARELLREDIVLAPQWWQDAGRLGAPDCGAVWGPAAEAIAATGH